MNKAIKEKWVKALRSGKYKQGVARLCSNNRYCVMGVLCDLAVKDGIGSWQNDSVISLYFNDSDYLCISILPDIVIKWAELQPHELKGDHFIYIKSLKTTVSALNDAGMSFNDLADIIEKEL